MRFPKPRTIYKTLLSIAVSLFFAGIAVYIVGLTDVSNQLFIAGVVIAFISPLPIVIHRIFSS